MSAQLPVITEKLSSKVDELDRDVKKLLKQEETVQNLVFRVNDLCRDFQKLHKKVELIQTTSEEKKDTVQEALSRPIVEALQKDLARANEFLIESRKDNAILMKDFKDTELRHASQVTGLQEVMKAQNALLVKNAIHAKETISTLTNELARRNAAIEKLFTETK